MSDPTSSIFRVLKGTTAVGAAFLVAPQLVATCAHVVEAASQTSGGMVTLKDENGETFAADVLPAYWRAVKAEDVAILRLQQPLDGVEPLRLSPSVEAKGHPFSTYGFPDPTQELPGAGDILGLARVGSVRWLQLRSPEVARGFSGAPVFDDSTPHLPRVVGMIVSITPPDEYERLGTTAFAIPAETLHQVCPELPIEATFETLAAEFLALPEMDAVDFFEIHKIYHLCFDGITLLPPLPAIHAQISGLLGHLAQAIPLPKNYTHPLACFALTLADCLQFSRPNLSGEILVWLQKHSGKLLLDWNNRAALIRVDPKQAKPPCLQIILNENTISNQPNADPKSKRYLLKARDARANRQLFCEPGAEFGKLAALIRQKAITEMLNQLDSNDSSQFQDQLWIEFILKTEDLSRKVDHWRADEISGETLGQTYKLVVRSHDRLKNLTHFHKTWSGKWVKCDAALTNASGGLKHGMVKEKKVAAFQQAVEHLHVIGLPFDPAADGSDGELLTSLLESGIPVAVWTRRGVDSQLAEDWLEKHLTAHLDLRHLAEHVRQERKSGSELGKSLVLFWDNYDHKLDEEDSFVAPILQDEENAW